MAIRLIDTETLELKSFVGTSVPGYAILSHTWGSEADEVTLQDLLAISRGSESSKKNRLGYRKINETCQKAKSTGIEYCWVDTCCIDKTSSAELSEAINSMFRWYRDAVICYVLLSDFEIGDSRDLTPIGKCRWFKRGWCLQELVAPQRVEFFNRSWNFLGSRKDLSDQISKITAIAKNVLTGEVPIAKLPVAQRLAWAANRDTTRKEDIAYCLLGIFDIHMPILYGEGTRAFIRLQEEIMKQSNDRSIFASEQPDDASRYCSLLAPGPECFAQCAHLVHIESHVYQGSAYSLTNRGLQFSETELCIDYATGIYVLPLYCMLRRGAVVGEGLPLEQVGPNLFARLSQRPRVEISRHLRWGLGSYKREVPSIVKNGIYITSHVTPLIHADLNSACRYSIQVSSDTLMLENHDALQVEDKIADRWDVAQMRVLARGRLFLESYWKLDVARALGLKDKYRLHDMTVRHCYLFCGLQSGRPGTMGAPWVFMCTASRELHQEAYDGNVSNPSDGLSAWNKGRVTYRLNLGQSRRLDLGRSQYTRMYLDASIEADTQQQICRLKINLTEAA
ncbi:unnamed protein product [Alternaria alternata]